MNNYQRLETKEVINYERELLLGVINRFIGRFSRQIQRKTMLETSREYPFVAMDTRQVFEQLLFVGRHLREKQGCQELDDFSFVDVGCGFGNVMLFAEQFGFDTYGIEKDETSIEVALGFFDEKQIIKADIMNYKGYGRFDVVYFFCPLTEGEREFEEFIEDEIRAGSILIGNYKRSKKIETDKRFRRLSTALPVWEKVSA